MEPGKQGLTLTIFNRLEEIKKAIPQTPRYRRKERVFYMVPRTGLEPVRGYPRQILSPNIAFPRLFHCQLRKLGIYPATTIPDRFKSCKRVCRKGAWRRAGAWWEDEPPRTMYRVCTQRTGLCLTWSSVVVSGRFVGCGIKKDAHLTSASVTHGVWTVKLNTRSVMSLAPPSPVTAAIPHVALPTSLVYKVDVKKLYRRCGEIVVMVNSASARSFRKNRHSNHMHNTKVLLSGGMYVET